MAYYTEGDMRLAYFAGDYEGVTHAGLCIVAADTGLVFLARRAMDETDDPAVQETWEFVGGGMNPGEDPQAAAIREFSEEIGFDLPDGEVVDGWRSPNGVYQGFVYVVDTAWSIADWVPTDEVQAVAWVTTDEAQTRDLRPEMSDFDWSLAKVSGNDEEFAMKQTAPEESPAEEAMETPAEEEAEEMAEPDYEPGMFAVHPIPVHGVLAPEETATGDQRGFSAGSITRRPLRLPLSDQKVSVSGHDGSVVVGSVDRLMRADGLIHWEGLLMPSPEADDLAGRMQFFGGRFGVSVDGDKGSLDMERSEAEEMLWFEAVRASGLTAVAIPAFHEAYVAFGPHPDMPDDETLAASAYEAGDLIGGRVTFGRGAGWVTNPEDTKRIHDYWTKKGQPGYAKIGWGTDGDFTRAKALIGEKIAANSPDKMPYLNQIIAQWHHDALGYWPGDLGMPGNAPDTAENRRRAAVHAAAEGIEPDEEGQGWEVVLTSSAGQQVRPPASYFERHPESGALVIEEPDANGIRRTYGYAGEWGVCHIGFDGRCVEVPADPAGGTYPDFHLGRTRTAEGDVLSTGLITYATKHRDAKTILSQTPEQAHFDDISHAWAAVRLGEDDRGVWFSGVVLPGVDDDDLTVIEAAGQVSGEWKYGALRTLLAVNVPGFPVLRSSAEYGEDGEVVALVASAVGTHACGESPAERMLALAMADAEVRMSRLRKNWGN